MAAEIYQSKAITRQKLDAYLKEMSSRGKTLLPTELELCGLLDASRRVIRELLQEKERKGEIIKNARSRELPLPIASAARFTFISGGENIPQNPTWAKLWIALQQYAPEYKLIPEMLFYSWETTAREFEKMLKDTSGNLIVSNLPHGACIPGGFRSNIIYLDEGILPEHDSFIGLDNRVAGAMAAEELRRFGYRRPAIMNFELDLIKGKWYTMYRHRVEGFLKRCQELHVPFSMDDVFSPRMPLSIGERMANISAALAQIQEKKYDSLFVVCDNDIAFIYDFLIHKGVGIPEKFGLITINSFDYALQHCPVVNSVSTGTFEIARTLLSFLSDVQTKPIRGNVHLYIKPDMHDGKTLIKQKENGK